jgi:hypothetical protein
MRNRVVGSLLIAAVSVGTSAPARAADLIRLDIVNTQVSAGFFGSGPTTCSDGSPGFVAAGGSLIGGQFIQSQTGQPTFNSNGVLVLIDFYFNSCTSQSLSGAGQVVNGLTPPDKKLTSAMMVGTALVQDFGTGATIPVSINVTVTGTGNLNQSKSSSKSRVIGTKGGPIFISHDHGQNQNRQGTAAGTISVDGVAIDPQFTFGLLNANDNSSVSITK